MCLASPFQPLPAPSSLPPSVPVGPPPPWVHVHGLCELAQGLRDFAHQPVVAEVQHRQLPRVFDLSQLEANSTDMDGSKFEELGLRRMSLAPFTQVRFGYICASSHLSQLLGRVTGKTNWLEPLETSSWQNNQEVTNCWSPAIPLQPRSWDSPQTGAEFSRKK